MSFGILKSYRDKFSNPAQVPRTTSRIFFALPASAIIFMAAEDFPHELAKFSIFHLDYQVQNFFSNNHLFLQGLVDGPTMGFYHLLKIHIFHFHFANRLMKAVL